MPDIRNVQKKLNEYLWYVILVEFQWSCMGNDGCIRKTIFIAVLGLCGTGIGEIVYPRKRLERMDSNYRLWNSIGIKLSKFSG